MSTHWACPLYLVLLITAVAIGMGAAAKASATPPVVNLPMTEPMAVVVGDPNSPGSLPQELSDAYAAGARRITIHPGVYLLPSTDGGVLTLNGWSDTTIIASGTVLILTDLRWNHNLWELDNCTNVTIRGGIVSQNQITSYQGRVVDIGQNPDGKSYADWKLDAGYPVPPAGSTAFPGAVNVVDRNTRMLKVGCTDYYSCPMSMNADGTYRVEFNGPTLNFGPGDWLVGRYGNAPFKIHLVNSRNCTIQNVIMMRNGFANIREEGGGGNHILGCVWALGPKPANATENPLVTNAADGLHSTMANPGPDIEDCVFQGVLLDDCIAIHGYFTSVISGSGNTITIANKDTHNFAIGDSLRITDSKGFIADSVATAVADNGNGTSTVTLDKSINVPSDAKFSASDKDGQGCKILRCHIGGTRSRGILLKGDNGLIEGNTFNGCGMSAVSLGPEFYWGESNYVRNVVVTGNTFNHNGIFGSGGACVWVHGEGAIGNGAIQIENNTFTGDLQTNVHIEWANGVTVAGNKFTGALPWPSVIPMTNVIYIDNSQNVAVNNNTVANSSVFKLPVVSVGENVTGM